MHEAQMHKQNAFITLTYNDENLKDPSLRHRDYQLFMKRLRKSASQEGRGPERRISYYMAGEYGGQNRRPHFHACVFGWQPADKKYWRSTASKSKLYTSELLDRLWRKGFTSIGEVTFESAAYIARYIINKVTGQLAGKYYEHINETTGEIQELLPEYNRMSLKPAIGQGWLTRYATDAYPEGKILIRGYKSNTPKYYDKQFKRERPEEYEEMKMKRELQGLEYREDNTPQRLKAKETVTRAKINQLLRNL